MLHNPKQAQFIADVSRLVAKESGTGTKYVKIDDGNVTATNGRILYTGPAPAEEADQKAKFPNVKQLLSDVEKTPPDTVVCFDAGLMIQVLKIFAKHVIDPQTYTPKVRMEIRKDFSCPIIIKSTDVEGRTHTGAVMRMTDIEPPK
jgi:hypothetical protein